MTTCPFCLDHMAARAVGQLEIRRNQIEHFPSVQISPCPQCHGVEWATTDYMVEPDPPLAPVGVQRIVGIVAILAVSLMAIYLLPRIL